MTDIGDKVQLTDTESVLRQSLNRVKAHEENIRHLAMVSQNHGVPDGIKQAAAEVQRYFESGREPLVDGNWETNSLWLIRWLLILEQRIQAHLMRNR